MSCAKSGKTSITGKVTIGIKLHKKTIHGGKQKTLPRKKEALITIERIHSFSFPTWETSPFPALPLIPVTTRIPAIHHIPSAGI
jgi:hypothetical protein